MEKFDFESLKDAVYEFEGLLELACLREDKIDALLPLMKNKLDLINAYFNEDLSGEDDPEEMSEGEEQEEQETDISVEDETVESEPDHESEVDNELFVITPGIDPIEEDDEDLPLHRVSDGMTEGKKRQESSHGSSVTKPAFCINDRFRFRRELFNNSDKDFDAAMNLVATMENYDEAEDYFIGESGWDMETPEVADFMAIIRNYFEK